MPPSPEPGERAAIARRAGLVAGGTLVSRLLGAARDAVIAACFPIAATDAFFVAFTIPNALRVLLGEGAASAAFVPVFSEVREKEGPERARLFHARLTGSMMLVLAVVTVLGIAAAPWLVLAYAGGFRDDPGLFDETVTLTRVVFPYIFLMGLAALAIGALNAVKRFGAAAFAPALLNVALIAAPFTLLGVAGALGLSPVGALAIGALLGGVLQVVVLLPSLRREGLLDAPRIGLGDPYVRKAFKLLVPLLAGLGVYQVNVMLGRHFASLLPEGAVSYLYYGQRLVEIPQGMFAVAIATASLPTLADLRSRGDDAEAKRLFRYGLRLSMFVAVPSSVVLAVIAVPIVTVLFGRGAFDAVRTAETARALLWMAAGIWAVSSVRTVVPFFYAYNDTRSPVICSAVNLVVFVGLSVLLMGPMEHAGIAAAISGAGAAQLLALIALLRRRTGPIGLGEVVASTARIAAASAVMGGALWFIARLGAWERGGNDPRNIAVLVLALVVGAVVFLGAARVLSAPELGELRDALRRRVKR